MIKKLKLHVFTFFSLLVCFQAISQEKCDFEVKGKVVDQESQEPIEGAYIWISDLEKGTVTNQNGNFHLKGICEGHYQLSVEFLGYTSQQLQLNVHEQVNMTVRLVPKEYLIDGVEIIGHKDAVNTLNNISHLGKDIMEENRGVNLGETLKALPGVTTFSTGANITKPVIHGMHSNRIMILNNEVRQEGQQWGGEHAPEVDPFMAEDISVVKGAETVRFGPEAMGGVILVTPPKLPVSGGINGSATVVGATNGWNGAAAFSLEGGAKKLQGFGYRIQASSRIGGNIKTPEYYQDNTGMRELNFSGAVGYNTKKLGMELFYSRFASTIGILSDSHTGNSSDLEELIANGRPFSDPDFSYTVENPRQEVVHQLFKAKGHYHLNNDGVVNLKYAFQQNNRQEYDVRRGSLNDRAALDLELFTNTLDLSYEHPSNNNWNGSFGINAIQQANNNIPGTGVTPLIPNYDMINLGAFVIEKYTKGPLELEGGARYDYRYVDAARYNQGELDEQDFTFQNFSAFLGAGYSLSDQWLITTNLGSAWRPPNINEQFSQGLHHGAAAVEIGDPNLVSEQAIKWVNTINFDNEKLTAELTGYYHKINNYIYLNPTGEEYVSLRGTFNVFEYLQTDASFWGIDLSTDYVLLPPLSWFVKGSMIRAKNLSEQNYLPFIPADRVETGLVYETNAIGKLTFSNLTAFKQRREPDFDLAPAPPGYNLWNISISKSFIENEKSRLNGSLTVNNLLNTEYKDYMNRFRYFTHEMGRNITLRINYEF
ncbi:TonB-dependent receptor [Echinicola strongylocentroti]|uniref:TonB-dependent receptor n=1 Tax=Echinicola strongylocentroti TaxID=1795355 RepID=A0A2Z4IPJ5_9BACT|nr:TonB-dependent receptor [Echinicola strongylocentroti]AWW32568.1 TonB-dependent receptor [Echinicola strongylocentroti]